MSSIDFYNNHTMLLIVRKKAAVNGDIVTGSDSDDSEQYLGLQNAKSDRAKALILKKMKSLRHRARHMKAKIFAERNFLACKQSSSSRNP